MLPDPDVKFTDRNEGKEKLEAGGSKLEPRVESRKIILMRANGKAPNQLAMIKSNLHKLSEIKDITAQRELFVTLNENVNPLAVDLTELG